MIDKQVFLSQFDLLLERFDRKPTDTLIAAYYSSLSHAMTTEEFVQASNAVFFEDDFFPSPKRLLDKVKLDSKALALKEWTEIVSQSSCNVYTDDSRLSPTAIKALRSVGGLQRVGLADISRELPFIKKDFLEAYALYAAPASINGDRQLTGTNNEQRRIAG